MNFILLGLPFASPLAVAGGTLAGWARCETQLSPTYTDESEILRWKLPADSLAADLVRLVYNGKLKSQTDPGLRLHRLLQQGGGLCNSTCTAAVIVTQSQPYPVARESAGDHLNQIVEAVSGLSVIRGRDARYGSNVAHAADYLKRKIDQGEIPDSLVLRSFTWGMGTLEDVDMEPGDINFTEVSDETSGHAIIVVAQNPATQLALIYDPNYPDRLFARPYKFQSYPNRVVIAEIPSVATKWVKFGRMLKLRRGVLKTLTPEMREHLER